jgi:hypothetical protein
MSTHYSLFSWLAVSLLKLTSLEPAALLVVATIALCKVATAALLHSKNNSTLSDGKHWQMRLEYFTVKQDDINQEVSSVDDTFTAHCTVDSDCPWAQ